MLSYSGEENKNFGQLSHPTELNIPTNTISITEAEENDLSKFKRLTSIFNQKPVAVIGDDLKKKEELLGEVESVNITAEGDILVLDSRQNKIKVFDDQGILLTEFGKTGHGPGELNSPEAMLLTNDSQIIVIDRFNKVHSYKYKNRQFQYLDTITLDYVPVDICALSDEFIIRGIRHSKKGFNQATILHSYSLEDFSYKKSFGRPYNSENGLIINQLSDGPIVCDSETNSIMVMFEYLPYVYSYNAEGKRNWMAELENFEGLNITENRNGSVTFSPKSNGVSEVGKSITKMKNEYVILQTQTHINRKVVYHKTFIINIRDGSGNYIGKDYPLIYDWSKKLVVAGASLKVPSFQIIVRR